MNGLDNQQRKISEAELGWLAGFWDGEGSIGLRLNRSHPGTRGGLISPYVQISNTNADALDRVAFILHGIGVGHHIQELRLHPKPTALSRLPQYRIVVFGYKRVTTFLHHVLPYLVVKRPAALLVERFIVLRASKPATALYSDEEWDILAQVRGTQAKLNDGKPAVRAS